MTPTITLKEACILLNRKDIRTVERFCEINEIPILLQSARGGRYIMRLQFEYILYANLISYLKKKYQGQWFEIFHDYMSMNYRHFSDVTVNELKKDKVVSSKYQASGTYENEFLNKLKNLTK